MTPVGLIHTVKPKGVAQGAPETKGPLGFEISFRTSWRRGWIQHISLESTSRSGPSDSDSGIGALACPSRDRQLGNAVGDFAGMEGRKKSVQ
jgi:hypothetical protein